jgi:sphingomyelin phosphodiesterase acid-like 3
MGAWLAISLVAGAPLLAGQATENSSEAGNVVLLSDIHFNPLPNGCPNAEAKQLVAEMAAKDAKKWSAQDFRLQARIIPMGQDSEYALLSSALRAAHGAAPKARLVIVPGDLLVHHFEEHFKACAPESTDADFTRFAAKTLEFVVLEIARSFPKAQVVPVLGNNDSDVGDYTEPSVEMLKLVGSGWQPVVDGNHKDGHANFATFAAGGYYTARLIGWKHLQVAALNSNAWSAKFRDAGKATASVGDQQLEWLQDVLTAAEKAGDRVVLVGHIPPGLDAYATRNSGGRRIVTMYEECGEAGASATCQDFGHAVPSMMQRFAPVIAMGVFGHTHQNEFRLVGDPKATVPIQVVPSISPVLNNNPSFFVVTADEKFVWRDYTVWVLPLSSASTEKNAAPETWRVEYNFDAAYGQARWGASELRALVEKLNDDPGVRKEFFLRMGAGNPQVEVPTRWQEAYICGLSHMTPEVVLPCVASAQTGLPLP